MMTDTPESVTLVPIDRIEVLNSRDRNMKVFEEIVENIRSIGLKKPITVTERDGADGAPAYLLVCGEGRLNAFRLLGESHIPALVVNVTDEDAFIMSLAENIARRGHRPLEILADIELLLARDGVMTTRKFKQIVSSIREIGLIEPLSVIKPDPDAAGFLLLDGNLRVLALKELGQDTAPCLIAKDFETYTYNHRINRLSTVQEHYMLRRAIDKGVSKERLARAFNVNLSTINSRINLLHGICPKAVELLQDHQFTPDVTRHLRKMKAARQIEAVELMIAANTITAAHADALLKATPPEQRTDYKPPQLEQPKGDPLEQIVKLEREMSQVQEKYKHAEENYGSELLNLVVAKGYLKKLMENEAVRSYVARHASEILEQFELVLNTVSMEEAVEQAEREEGPSAAEATAQAQLVKDDSDAASDSGMDGQLG